MRFFVGLLAVFVFMTIPFIGGVVHAESFDPLNPACQNAVNDSDAQPICNASSDPVDPVNGQDGLIAKTANILAFIAGIVAVVIVIIAGITMMTANGDAGKITSSRNAIIYTVVGLLVIIAARTIVIFVLGRVAT